MQTTEMNLPNVQFNEFLSLALMLLMIAALAAGQASADDRGSVIAADPVPENVLSIDVDGRVGVDVLSIRISAETHPFRGEDE